MYLANMYFLPDIMLKFIFKEEKQFYSEIKSYSKVCLLQ